MILRVRDDEGNVFDIPAIRGLSSYEIAVKHGFIGTEKEWLESIGVLQGLSAYEVALEDGFEGTLEEWLESLIGPQGPQGEQGPQGPKGDTPTFVIGNVTTLSAGSNATATITGTPEKPILNLGIPKGDKGDKGATGDDATPSESLPSVSTGDNGKFLRVVSGVWKAVTVSEAEGASF